LPSLVRSSTVRASGVVSACTESGGASDRRSTRRWSSSIRLTGSLGSHLAERLDGKPAPQFAASTRFTIDLVRDGDGTSVRLRSAQTPAGPLRGLVMRLFGQREIAENLERSLDRLAATLEG
jgi:hypothetical protein